MTGAIAGKRGAAALGNVMGKKGGMKLGGHQGGMKLGGANPAGMLGGGFNKLASAMGAGQGGLAKMMGGDKVGIGSLAEMMGNGTPVGGIMDTIGGMMGSTGAKGGEGRANTDIMEIIQPLMDVIMGLTNGENPKGAPANDEIIELLQQILQTVAGGKEGTEKPATAEKEKPQVIPTPNVPIKKPQSPLEDHIQRIPSAKKPVTQQTVAPQNPLKEMPKVMAKKVKAPQQPMVNSQIANVAQQPNSIGKSNFQQDIIQKLIPILQKALTELQAGQVNSTTLIPLLETLQKIVSSGSTSVPNKNSMNPVQDMNPLAGGKNPSQEMKPLTNGKGLLQDSLLGGASTAIPYLDGRPVKLNPIQGGNALMRDKNLTQSMNMSTEQGSLLGGASTAIPSLNGQPVHNTMGGSMTKEVNPTRINNQVRQAMFNTLNMPVSSNVSIGANPMVKQGEVMSVDALIALQEATMKR